MTFGDYRKQLASKWLFYLRALGDLGTETAQRQFDAIPPEYDNSDVSVEYEMDDWRGFTITASGEDAAFIEFGAGVNAGVRRNTVQADFPIYPGSWSESEQGTGEFAKYGSWHHNGEKFYGSPAMGGMQEACNAMQQQSPAIVRRIFG